MSVRVLIPSGVLGLGFDSEALQRGLDLRPDIICIDGGSTDSGPFYLGTGTSKYARAASRSEWRELMLARAQANIPLVIGSCGTCGTDDTVDWMFEITKELANELGQTLKIATLYSSQSPDTIAKAFTADEITPLAPAPALDLERIAQCSNIVALAGAEQITAALETGADIVLAGRTTDTAIISALPLANGVDAGIAWHGAKIGECGALCSTHPTSGVIVIDFDKDSFTVQPLADDAVCTPHSVSAHMLYENSDPFILYEPGGYLDVTDAIYSSTGDTSVTVSGSRWVPSNRYTVKLEGATLAGYQSTILAVLRDAHYVQNAQQWVDRLHPFLVKEIQHRMALDTADFDLEFRLIGQNSVLGVHESKVGMPTEIGVLGIITAKSAEISEEIGKLINPFVLHYPLTDNEELPTFAFPYSPAQSERGALYEFSLNHTLELHDPMQAFRLSLHNV
ncbi:MAG: DUF1446 domain-containing protein [Granulosicoccus sp.]|nr:DUF1446 domain-containing protein [Granulosicoccus sp.]